jgi:hypothetical protein
MMVSGTATSSTACTACTDGTDGTAGSHYSILVFGRLYCSPFFPSFLLGCSCNFQLFSFGRWVMCLYMYQVLQAVVALAESGKKCLPNNYQE